MSTPETFASLPWIRRHFPGGLDEGQRKRLADTRRLLTRFESIGTSPRFGTVQRSYAHEYMSLLRWSDLSLDRLISGMEKAWANIGKIETMKAEFRQGPNHFFIIDDGVVFHTPETDSAADSGKIRNKYSKRNKTLVKNFIGNATAASKYFVVFVPDPDMPDEKVATLGAAIRKYNPTNKLLCVHRSTEANLAGEISVQSPNLIYGHVRERDEDIEDGLAWPDWIKICQKVDAAWSAAK